MHGWLSVVEAFKIPIQLLRIRILCCLWLAPMALKASELLIKLFLIPFFQKIVFESLFIFFAFFNLFYYLLHQLFFGMLSLRSEHSVNCASYGFVSLKRQRLYSWHQFYGIVSVHIMFFKLEDNAFSCITESVFSRNMFIDYVLF